MTRSAVGSRPLCGRDDELAALLGSVAGPDGHGTVVTGAPGVGKSALVRAACEVLDRPAFTVHTVRATRAVATIPFGAFVRFVPTGSGAPVHQLEMLARLADELRASAGDGRLVLGLDDAHLLDDSSAALVLSLAESGAAVLATVPTGEPLGDAVGALVKDLGLRRLELGPLDRGAFEHLVSADLGGPFDPAMGDRLWALSGGNPLFASELLRGGRQQGVVVEDRRTGRWTWSGTLPRCELLHDLLRRRLDEGGPVVREVVEVVALAEPLALGALTAIVPVEAVSRAERAGLVAVDGDDAVRLAHPLIGELVRLEMGRARAAWVASELAGAVGALDDDGELLRVASWQLQGSPATADPDVLARAAARASAIGESDTAVHFATAALDRGAGRDVTAVLADSLYFAGRFDDVDDVVAPVLADPAAPSGLRRSALIRLSSTQFWGRSEVAEALELLEGGAVGLDPADRHEVEAHLASIEFFAGDVTGTIARLERLLADPTLGPGGRVRAGTLAGAALALGGRVDDALRAIDGSFSDAFQLGVDLAGFVGGALLGRSLALLTAGRLDETEQAVRGLAEMARDQRRALFTGPLHMMLGRVLLLRGRLAEAIDEFDRADVAVDVDAGRMLGWSRAMRARAVAQSSGAAEAADALAAADAVRHRASGLFELDAYLAEAWVLAADGRRSAARDRAREAAERAGTAGAHALAAEAWHDLARLGDAPPAAAALRRLTGTLEGPLIGTRAEHAAALAARDGPALDVAARRLEERGLLLHAAEAAAEAATLHERAGRRGSALTSVAAARRLRDRCPGAAEPPTADTVVPLHVLTDREREVAELAARGHNNRAIAAELYLSIRTVNNHLNHVYAKLGFSDRGHLAAALGLAS